MHLSPHSTHRVSALAVDAWLQVVLRESELSAAQTELAKAQKELLDSEAQHRSVKHQGLPDLSSSSSGPQASHTQ